MANKTYQGRIVQKHDSSANWAKATNFIPLKGEIIIYDDLNKIKIGDGTTKVGDLTFINDNDDISGKYLPLTGGTMTGNLKVGSASLETSGYVTGTWLRTTANTALSSAPSKIAVINDGQVYSRTPEQIKSDIGLNKVDNIKQYSATNPPPYPVKSVNGKTGAVTISATDVSAIPSTLAGTPGDTLVKSANGETWETPIEATLVSLPTGVLKSDGTTITAATAGVDYAAVPNKYTFTVTNTTQSTFVIPFDFNNDPGTLTVYYNGVMMKETENYTISGNTITLVDWEAKVGDYITVMGIMGAASVNVSGESVGLFSTTKDGLTPKSDGSTTKYLRADGSWATIDKTPVIGTNTNYAIYIGSTQPASGTTPLLWIDTTASTGYLKYRTSTTGTWTTVPVAWT